MGRRQVLRDAIGVCVIQHRALAEPTAALGVFALQQMAFASVGAHDFASSGDFEPLGYGFLCFDAFGTSHKFIFSITKGRALYAAGECEASAIFSRLGCPSCVPVENQTTACWERTWRA